MEYNGPPIGFLFNTLSFLLLSPVNQSTLRKKGGYYDEMWSTALSVVDRSSSMISITSFNEWHEVQQQQHLQL